MRAVLLPHFGGPELFEVEEMPPPTPEAGEVLVRVMASGTNPVDAKVRQQGSWAQLEFPAVLGYDAAGVVEEVGEGVRDLKPGDEVYFTPPIFGNSRGTYAELTISATPASVVALFDQWWSRIDREDYAMHWSPALAASEMCGTSAGVSCRLWKRATVSA